MKENELPAVNETKVPVLKDLVSDIASYEENDKLNFLLNQEPPKSWVKVHPYIKGHKYLPIDKIEYLLRKIFKEYRVEILREGNSFNGVFVSIRLHYKNLTSGEWSYHDGIGAINLQLRSQTKEERAEGRKVQFDTVNINNGALSMAYPLAKTLAIKDACDMFGKLFGSDLNRRDTLNASLDAVSKDDEKLKHIKILLEDVKDFVDSSDLDIIEEIIKNKTVSKYEKVLETLTAIKPN